MPDVLIWGASGGMGQALTESLLQAGWRVFAAARDVSKIPAGVHQAYPFDAADPASIQDIAMDLAHETTGLDLSVYAAGELRADFQRQMSPESWSAVLDSNLNGAFLTASHTLQLMAAGGHMMFVGAYVDHLILPKMGAYAAAKAGLETLVQVLQKEHRKLHFTLLKPGAVDTPFWLNAPFRLPAGAKTPQRVAQALLTQYQNGDSGVLAL
jgi:NAD(P)-dependent dehydrogenase (short-subunit alcohol dehydrogenase family)